MAKRISKAEQTMYGWLFMIALIVCSSPSGAKIVEKSQSAKSGAGAGLIG